MHYIGDYIATITGYKDDNSLKAYRQHSAFSSFLLKRALEQIANLTHSTSHRKEEFGIDIPSLFAIIYDISQLVVFVYRSKTSKFEHLPSSKLQFLHCVSWYASEWCMGSTHQCRHQSNINLLAFSFSRFLFPTLFVWNEPLATPAHCSLCYSFHQLDWPISIKYEFLSHKNSFGWLILTGEGWEWKWH